MAGNTCSNPVTEINVKAFLRLIRFAEHGRDDPSTYYTLYGGGKFTDISQHPLTDKPPIEAWGKKSTAAGAYQIKLDTWGDAHKQGYAYDFSSCSQDNAAVYLIKTRGALDYIRDGQIEKAVRVLKGTWVSLPGGSQSKMTMEHALKLFEKYVAEENRR